MIRRPPRSTLSSSSAASDVYKRQIATNISGSRRILKGAARDHVLGIRAINGRGEVIKAGGRVMKNVTGYDLGRTLAGSWGTLAIMTEVSLKVLPAQRAVRTVICFGLTDQTAIEASV